MKTTMLDLFKKVFLFNSVNFYYYLILLSVLILSTFLFEINILPYIIFFFIGFGWSLFFFGKKLSIIENLIISPAISFSVLTSFIAILSLSSINLSILIFYLFIILSVFLFYKTDTFKKENFRWRLEWFEILVIVMFLIALFVKIVPTLGMEVPNLSDTMTHAYYSKLIMDTGEISFFYSPGLHIISAYSTMLGGYTVPLQILYITNFFSAYAGLIVYLFVKKIFNKKIVALWSALFISLGPGLSLFFYSGGKNALVIAISILFCFLFVSSFNKKNPSLRINILSIILIFSTFIVHYPTAVFACIFWFSLLIVDIRKNLKQQLITFIGILLGFIYLFIKFFLFSDHSSSAIPSEVPMLIPLDFVGEIVQYSTSLFQISGTHVFLNLYKPIYIIVIFGFLSFLYKLFGSKERIYYKLFGLWTISCFLLGLVISTFSIVILRIVLETYMLSLFMFLYIILAFGISFIFSLISSIKNINKKILLVVFLAIYITATISLSMSIYKTYTYFAPMLSVVKEDDVEMFEWIDQNISDEPSIITNGFYATPVLVGPSDSGGWLTIFTENKTSTPFWEFSHRSTINNLENYKKLQKNLNDCEAINYFLDNGFEYYFQGALPIRDVLGEPMVLEENGWELIHTVGRTFLFKIPTCEE